MPSPTGPIRALCLVGFMGAGKTTVGRALAQQLHWHFLDLDDLIQDRAQRTIAQIFAESGESAFRALERAALLDVFAGLPAQPSVVALGGGAYVHADNAQHIRGARVPVVFLDAPLEELRQRCQAQQVDRPLLRDQNQFRQLYEARRSGYMAADLLIDTLRKTVEQVANEIIARLQLKGTHGS